MGVLELSQLQSDYTKQGENIPLFMEEYFNLKPYYQKTSCTVKYASTRMLNSLIEVVADRHRLPKYLIVIPDKDMLEGDVDVFNPAVSKIIPEIVRWFVRQIDLIIRRWRSDFLVKKPESLTSLSTKMIYVRMLRRMGHF